jgi:hypothetical protein
VSAGNVEEALDWEEGEPEIGSEAEAAADALMERVVHRPTACTVVQLRSVARALGVAVGGIKAELVSRLLQELRLGDRPAPAHVPARLVLRVYLERAVWRADSGLTRPLNDEITKAIRQVQNARVPGAARATSTCCCLADLQEALCLAFPVTPGDRTTHERLLIRAGRLQEAEEIRMQQERREAERYDRRQRHEQQQREAALRRQDAEQQHLQRCRGLCVSCRDNALAKECPHKMCGYCCRGCNRHMLALMRSQRFVAAAAAASAASAHPPAPVDRSTGNSEDMG